MFDDQDNERKSMDEIRKMPIMLKAEEITDLVYEFLDVAEAKMPDNLDNFHKHLYKHHVSYLRQNATIIPAKIADAMGVTLYDIRMENAAIIRRAARELMTDSTGLRAAGFKSIYYIQLLRDAVEEFRVLFTEWVKTFDLWDYIIDRWGLFNPTGLNYDDHDPNDDIPFDPKARWEELNNLNSEDEDVDN